jgi:hypothetical protein
VKRPVLTEEAELGLEAALLAATHAATPAPTREEAIARAQLADVCREKIRTYISTLEEALAVYRVIDRIAEEHRRTNPPVAAGLRDFARRLTDTHLPKRGALRP